MKTTFTRLIAACLLLIGITTASAAVLTTNLTANGTYLLSTDRASVYSIQVASTSPGLLSFYDADSLAAPYYGTNYTTTSNLVTATKYATNVVSSFVGYNGYTNWYTNAGVYTLYTTNTSLYTNALTPLTAVVVPEGMSATYAVDALFSKGIVIRANPATNVSVVIQYNRGE